MRALFTGFAPSLAEVLVFVIVVAGFVGLLIIYMIVARRRQRSRQKAIADRRYAAAVQERELGPTDIGVIEELSRYLRNPDKRYVLLQNHTVFNRCVEQALEDGAISSGDAAALRVRLGFAGSPAGAEPESSSEIPEQSGVLVVDQRDHVVRGRVIQPLPSAFRVQTDPDARKLTSGTAVDVIHQDGSGIYRFESGVLSHQGSELNLLHSEKLQRVQRRRYYRGKVRLPVYVTLSHTSERAQPTELIDIGGGGASFYAPDARYQRGAQVEMTFHPDSLGTLHLSGEIVRESKRGRVVHVSFSNVNPAVRRKIFGFLFRNTA